MMAFKARDIAAALCSKGFETNETDHTWFVYYTLDGRKTLARTKMSHCTGGKDIGDTLLAQMARQLRLTKPEFGRLVECPMGREEYEKRLDEQGHL